MDSAGVGYCLSVDLAASIIKRELFRQREGEKKKNPRFSFQISSQLISQVIKSAGFTRPAIDQSGNKWYDCNLRDEHFMIIWSEPRLPSQSDVPEDLYFTEDLDGSCGRDLDFKENTLNEN